MDLELREAVPAYGKKRIPEREYLEWERAGDLKHEYFQGEVFAMSGAGDNHNVIYANVFGELFAHLKNSGCRPFGSDMRMNIPENTLYTYPDIAVYCRSDKRSGNDEDTFTNARLIIEILSPLTRRYDEGRKFDLYKDIPALRDYVLIDSSKIAIVTHSRDGYEWISKHYEENDSIRIDSIDFSMPVKEVYSDFGKWRIND